MEADSGYTPMDLAVALGHKKGILNKISLNMEAMLIIISIYNTKRHHLPFIMLTCWS